MSKPRHGQFSEAVFSQHNQKEHPVSKATGIMLISLAFRMLDQVRKSCGQDAVTEIIECRPHTPERGALIGERLADCLERRAKRKIVIARERRRRARFKEAA